VARTGRDRARSAASHLASARRVASLITSSCGPCPSRTRAASAMDVAAARRQIIARRTGGPLSDRSMRSLDPRSSASSTAKAGSRVQGGIRSAGVCRPSSPSDAGVAR
jgi:hypothetical protein